MIEIAPLARELFPVMTMRQLERIEKIFKQQPNCKAAQKILQDIDEEKASRKYFKKISHQET
jgi:hypothetical protein